MEFNNNKLSKGLLGAFFITLGIILSEKSIESFDFNAFIGVIFYVFGWYMFLSTQSGTVLTVGIIVPIVAIVGQIYFKYILNQSRNTRRNLALLTAAFWIIFIAVWVYYVYLIGNGNVNRATYVYIGLALLLISILGYYFYRKNDWNRLTGGILPIVAKDASIFNPLVGMLPFAWSLLAIGNAIQ